MNKKIIVWILCLLLLVPLCACANPAAEKAEKQGLAMDTVIDLTAYGSKANEAIDAAYKRISEIEQLASADIVTSDVSLINQSAGKSPVKVHPEILKMIQTAIKYNKLTGGAFDITVGPLIQLWGIGTDHEKVPAPSEITAALALVGSDKIVVNEADSTVGLTQAGMAIDLGGIAKGFTADEVLQIFKNYGIKSALINMGASSIYTLGQKPDGTLWAIGVQHPRENDAQVYLGVIHMPEKALSTSGDYERYFIKDGVRYHHIIDPATGYPADSGVMSDTIIISSDIPDCNMLADILTKVTFVLGADKGFKLIDTLPGVSCLAVTTDYKILKSSGWNVQLDDVSSDFSVAGE
jgi:FAD:protein FMN transferase